MKMSALFSMFKNETTYVLFGLMPGIRAVYRLAFLAGASRSGVLRLLARGPRPLDEVARELGADPAGHDALESWLRVGVLIGELGTDRAGYRLRGYLARKLARDANDAAAAFNEEIVMLHTRLLAELPARLGEGQPFTFADQDGEVIARSSRTLEPAVVAAIQHCFPRQGRVRLLEVGCGSGVYLRHASEWNPELTGLGLELQPEVADLARANLERWGLAGRFEVAAGDVRDRRPDPDDRFDLMTLHNNIYYFPVADRVDLLRHLRGFLAPGGKLLITTGAQGGSFGLEVLSLWAAATKGCGRLPSPSEMTDQLREAGFEPAPPVKLVPGEAYYGFVGTVS